jgi:hypothetical protein
MKLNMLKTLSFLPTKQGYATDRTITVAKKANLPSINLKIIS